MSTSPLGLSDCRAINGGGDLVVVLDRLLHPRSARHCSRRLDDRVNISSDQPGHGCDKLQVPRGKNRSDMLIVPILFQIQHPLEEYARLAQRGELFHFV